MDQSAIQRSITTLEDRYQELREIGDRKLQALEQEKQYAQNSIEDLRRQLELKVVELQRVVGERDVRAKEKGEAQKAVEDLKQQVLAKGGELEKEERRGRLERSA